MPSYINVEREREREGRKKERGQQVKRSTQTKSTRAAETSAFFTEQRRAQRSAAAPILTAWCSATLEKRKDRERGREKRSERKLSRAVGIPG